MSDAAGRLTRRALFEKAAFSALGAWGIYECLPTSRTFAFADVSDASHPLEQHLLPGMRVATLPSGMRVIVQPTYHQLVTARLRVDERASALQSAQRELEQVLARLDSTYTLSPSGLGLTLAWGLPYFRRFVAAPAADNLPLDLRLSRRDGRKVLSLLDAIRFPSDPESTVLEENDIAFYFRSDSRAHIGDANEQIFGPLGELFEITTIRKGFVGAGLPRARALATSLPVGSKIDTAAPLYCGAYPLHPFGEGPGRITNVETLGYAGRVEYFRHGTHMHVSHLYEDLASFYAADAGRRSELLLGHGFAISRRTGLTRPQRGPDGHVYSANSGIIQRCYASTLDNPFFWSADQSGGRRSAAPSPGLHFVSFAPTSNEFHRYRFAMDGLDDEGRSLPANVGAARDNASRAFNRLIRASHRQNFIVPPRARRSFPLAELVR